jgi:hypothetical protein
VLRADSAEESQAIGERHFAGHTTVYRQTRPLGKLEVSSLNTHPTPQRLRKHGIGWLPYATCLIIIVWYWSLLDTVFVNVLNSTIHWHVVSPATRSKAIRPLKHPSSFLRRLKPHSMVRGPVLRPRIFLFLTSLQNLWDIRLLRNRSTTIYFIPYDPPLPAREVFFPP